MKKKTGFGIIFIVLILAIFSVSFFTRLDTHSGMTMEKHIELTDSFKQDLMLKGMYRCCLDKPCDYCLKKEEGCDCMDDLYDGKHPCGECIGEILEGHGNQFLVKYFATAIAEKVGEDHLDTLKQIIFEKYGMPVEEQV